MPCCTESVTRLLASACLAMALVACAGAATPPAGATAASASQSAQATSRSPLPAPVPQPVTRTTPGAQIAWVSVTPTAQGGHASFVGIDRRGRIVGRLDPGIGRLFRSADGSQLFAIGDEIKAYSALDGTFVRSYGTTAGGSLLDAAFSPDGRWLALIGSPAYLQIVDLQSTAPPRTPQSPGSQVTPLAHDSNAAHPGLTGAAANALIWSTLVFSPDSKRVYTMVDWGGPARITGFDVTPTGLVQTATAVDGQAGKTLPSCPGPAIAPKIVDGGRTLAVFCHFDGQIAFVDLATLTGTGVVRADVRNPFWLAPIFTPDGQLLYLHQYPAFGDVMQVVDLHARALLGPIPTPQKLSDPGPFGWLFPVAYAGGTPSTVPLSPDGLELYAASNDGITVLRIPDLKPVRKLLTGRSANEVWISGDGNTVYATDTAGRLFVMARNAAQTTQVDLQNVGGFLASEHG